MFFNALIGGIDFTLTILRSLPFGIVAAWAHGSFSRIFKVDVTGWSHEGY